MDKIKANLEKYYFCHFSADTGVTIGRWISGVRDERNILFGHATDLRAMNVEQDIDISFIGSIANWNHSLSSYFTNLHASRVAGCYPASGDENEIKDRFFFALDEFKKDPFHKFPYSLPVFDRRAGSEEKLAILLITANLRFSILSQLSDLGLKIFGQQFAFPDVMYYNYKLFRCFDFSLSVSSGHSTQNYNRSKISLNLPHAHAREGFSWRVCDILASNAVLLSNRQSDLLKLCKHRVDLPTYESAAEARDIARALLADPLWRSELSLACQALIDEKCRFEPKLANLESSISGVRLSTGDEGKISILNDQLYRKPISVLRQTRKEWHKYRNMSLNGRNHLVKRSVFYFNSLVLKKHPSILSYAALARDSQFDMSTYYDEL